jgi:hypothetical protein
VQQRNRVPLARARLFCPSSDYTRRFFTKSHVYPAHLSAEDELRYRFAVGRRGAALNVSLQGVEKIVVPIALPIWLTGVSILLPWPWKLAGLKRALRIDGVPEIYAPLIGTITLFFFFVWFYENVWGLHRTRLHRCVTAVFRWKHPHN